MGKIELNFSHSFQGKVWNLMIAKDGGYLLFEIREEENFKTSYFVLDLQSNQFVITDLVLDEEWWVGVTHFSKDLILFHTYDNQENPDNKSYIVFDIERQAILWQKTGLIVSQVNGAAVECIDPMADEVYTIDIRNGERSVSGDINPKEENKKASYAFHYVESSDYFATVNKFLASILNISIVGAVDYFQYEGGVVISYYTQKGKHLVNKLLVLNLKKDILLEETLGEELTGISDNTFFIYDDNLIFVKEKCNFFIYPLIEK